MKIRRENINLKQALELYQELGSLNKTAIKIGCCTKTLRRVFVANNIEINEPKNIKWIKENLN